jgi:hypothetical protein
MDEPIAPGGRDLSGLQRRHQIGDLLRHLPAVTCDRMSTLAELDGSKWAGTNELWLDPLGDNVTRSDGTIAVDGAVVRYTWSYEGKPHAGSVTLRGDVADFTDTWHQPEPMKCRRLPGAWGLFQVQGEYGPQSDWGWRIGLSVRAPSGELVLQMTNVAPWGEEVRAVRMICQRK